MFNRSSAARQEWSASYAAILQRREPAAIRAFLVSESPVASHLFLQLYVACELPDPALLRAWDKAKRVLLDLDAYTWGAKQKREKFVSLVADPSVLTALQGAVARGSDVTLDMLGVLALDGSSESIDALLPHLDPALVAGDVRLDLIQRLRKYAAATPAIQAILSEVDATLARRRAASPALEIPPLIGLGQLDMFWFQAWARFENRTAVIQGSIHVDCREPTWFRVHLSQAGRMDRRTAFTADALTVDGLDLGRCDAANLPKWLAASARTLGTSLDLGSPRTNLRGHKRDQLIAWLGRR